MLKGGIYAIKNLITKKFYIGRSENIHLRWQRHRSKLRGSTHGNQILQNSWNKHGESNFAFIIIENCHKETLMKREQYYLDLWKPYDRNIGYNICKNSGTRLGIPHTDETKKKISELNKGRKHSDEHKQRLSESLKGRKHSDEHKQRLSESKKGKKFSEEHKQRLSVSSLGNTASLGRKHSDEARKKISESKKGNDYNIGRKHSDEARKKISESKKGKKLSDEIKKKMSESQTFRRKKEKNKE